MKNKELRKHIKPYLRFSIRFYKKYPNTKYPKKGSNNRSGLCELAERYALDKKLYPEISDFIKDRLEVAAPSDIKGWLCGWYEFNEAGINKRIAFCELQLKIVKP